MSTEPIGNVNRRTAIAIAALALTGPAALAKAQPEKTMTDKPPTEIQSLIDAHINGFNAQDEKLFFGVFRETAIIIDGIAPYRWLNPNAAANWIADVEKMAQRPWRDQGAPVL
jgi:hypothetical protein